MKRLSLWIIALLAAVLLCGCQKSEKPSIYYVFYDGKDFTVDQEQGTVACDGVVYQFQTSSSSDGSVDLEIIYPDGSKYYWVREDSIGYGGWSDDYNPGAMGYVPGDVLWDVLGLEPVRRRDPGSHPLLALFLLAVGAFQAITPETAWRLCDGWRFENAEPSDLALDVNRIVGVVLICVGVIFLLASGF